MLAEPAFSNSVAWPPCGPGGSSGMPPEPDDPRPVHLPDTLRAEPALVATWRSGAATLDLPADRVLRETKPGSLARRQVGKLTVLISGLLHVAVALAFFAGVTEKVEIAGADESSVTLLGNAPDDQAASGDGMETTNVTLVTMLVPKPVVTVAAEPVQVADTLQAVRETPEAAAASTTAPITQSLKAALQPVRGETVASEVPVAPAAADPTPEVLTAQTAEPATSVVPPHVEAPVASDSLPTAEQVLPANSVVIETAPSGASELDKIDNIPVPQPRPAAKAKPVEAKRRQEKIQERPAKKARKKVAEQAKSADKPAKTRKKAGSGGRNETDARRGVADGRAYGQKEVSGSGGRTSAAGNAAVSNYPGKVAARLRRSVRGVSRPARSKAGRDVLVSFTVNAGGGLGGVRIARSSGSRELDKAALAIVRRAAPFPPIPAQSGRRNWAFTLPLGLR